MTTDYQNLSFPYRRSADQDAAAPVHHAVIVVGAGPVGLTIAIDLAQRGVPVVLLDEDNTLSTGSRAICFAKRTLEVWDRLGCAQRMVDKGVSWSVGKVFFQDGLAYSFDLLPESGHRRPAFINLQQYYVEGYLCERAAQFDNLDIRWKNKLTALEQHDDGVTVGVDTPEGSYRLRCDYLVAADGARSTVRSLIGLESTGRVFRDRFLIADVKMKADFPSERWFWFDPPFHRGQSALLHRQPDDVWRIDFQLGWDADPVAEREPARVAQRVQALLGAQTQFELQWVSIYTFACLRMEKFCHGRVFFTGDAAHGVSPFGARGANSGVQDADNLAWKLQWVLAGRAPPSLLESYATEREYAADENILNSTRSTDFITPKSEVSRVFRDAVLKLSVDYPFARRLVNSGRLSLPTTLLHSPLNTPDGDAFSGAMLPGAACADAPIEYRSQAGWLLSHLGGEFTLLHFADVDSLPAARTLARELELRATLIGAADELMDSAGLAAQRYDARPGTTYLIRPDQHVCARWRQLDAAQVRAALKRASSQPYENGINYATDARSEY